VRPAPGPTTLACLLGSSDLPHKKWRCEFLTVPDSSASRIHRSAPPHLSISSATVLQRNRRGCLTEFPPTSPRPYPCRPNRCSRKRFPTEPTRTFPFPVDPVVQKVPAQKTLTPLNAEAPIGSFPPISAPSTSHAAVPDDSQRVSQRKHRGQGSSGSDFFHKHNSAYGEVSDRSQPPMAFDLSRSESAGSGSLHSVGHASSHLAQA
jgi:hypothetical protein